MLNVYCWFELGVRSETLYYLDLNWFPFGDFAVLASAGGACIEVFGSFGLFLYFRWNLYCLRALIWNELNEYSKKIFLLFYL